MSIPVSTYGFLNAKLRAKISKMIPNEVFTQMIEARSFEEAIHVLNGSSYESAAGVYEQTGDLLMVELEIERLVQGVLKETSRYTRQFADSAVAEFTSVVLLRFDLVNLKNALRLWYERTVRGRSIENKLSYLLRSSGVAGLSLEALINAESVEELVDLSSSGFFASVIAEQLPKVVEERSLFPLESALDHRYYELLVSSISTLNKRDQAIAERLIGIEIDTINVNWIVRRKAFYSGSERVANAKFLNGGLLAKRDVLESALTANQPARQLSRIFSAGSTVPGEPPVPSDIASPGDSNARSLAFLEQILQQQLLYECRRVLGGYPFTIGIILAYFILVQQEARRVVSVLNGKNYEMAPDRLEALL